MKKQFQLYIFFVLCSVAMLPILNICKSGRVLRHKDELFAIDAIEGLKNDCLKSLGVSTDYSQVIVGKDGWLFLGDHYSRILSTNRLPVEGHLPFIDKQLRIIKEKQDFLVSQGIPYFYVLTPNKMTVYEDKMPDWWQSISPSRSDIFVDRAQGMGINILDLRPFIKQQRVRLSKPVFYKTDSHWNNRAGMKAFVEVMSFVNDGLTEKLILPKQLDVQEKLEESGDLQRLLKGAVTYLEDDVDYVVSGELQKIFYRPWDQFDEFITEKGPNEPVSLDGKSAFIKNDASLNAKRLLLLRDSFSQALCIPIHKTFRETWHVHHIVLTGRSFPVFIEENKPDIVIEQAVERLLIEDYFLKMPHTAVVSVEDPGLGSLSKRLFEERDLEGFTKTQVERLASKRLVSWNLSSADSQIYLPKFNTEKECVYLYFDCVVPKSTNIEIFYSEKPGQGLSEERKVIYSLKKGFNSLTLRISVDAIAQGLRIDPSVDEMTLIVNRFELWQ